MKILRWKYIFLAFLVLSDAGVIYASFIIAYKFRFSFEPFLRLLPADKGTPPWNLYAEALRLIVPLWIIVFAFWGKLYQRRFADSANEFLALAKNAVLATILMVAATFLYRQYQYSRLVMCFGFLASLTLLFLSRETWKWFMRKMLGKIVVSETVILVGESKSMEAVARVISRDVHKKIIAMPADNIAAISRAIDSDPDVGEIYVSGRLLTEENEDLQDLMDKCEDMEIEIKILPFLMEMRLGEIMVDDSLGLPVLHLKPLSLHGFRYMVKRVFDISLCLLIVAALFIPFLFISVLIMLDSRGGPFFVQERVGFKGKRFKCVKFRTMHRNAEKLLEEMKLQSFRGGPAFKMIGDPRITRMGKWLRRFSLDELAQVWNILKGEMSLIGPRPQVLAEAQGNPEWAKRRYRVLPGITGLWQVSGRADLSYEDMMRLDIYYLENWSPGLDLRIILKTFPVVFFGKGAY